jgi:predicted deacylase
LIRRLLRDDDHARRCRERYCVYVMPMANKDGVARGRTRFNALGKDLNRNWDQPADGRYAPENHALESWLESMIAEGRRPDLAIDFHNDAGGKLHVSRPDVDLEAYLERMQRFEQLLREHTWFTEGSTGGSFRNPGSFGEGLLERYGITACVQELNANRIAGLDDYPSAANWKLFGEQLCEVFLRYFGG